MCVWEGSGEGCVLNSKRCGMHMLVACADVYGCGGVPLLFLLADLKGPIPTQKESF